MSKITHDATSSALPKEMRVHKQDKENIIEMRIEARFGARLRALRKERCITQVDLAEKLGIHQNYISEIERGKRNITLRVIEHIARALEVTERELFNWRE